MSTTPMTATHYVSNTSLYSAKAWGCHRPRRHDFRGTACVEPHLPRRSSPACFGLCHYADWKIYLLRHGSACLRFGVGLHRNSVLGAWTFLCLGRLCAWHVFDAGGQALARHRARLYELPKLENVSLVLVFHRTLLVCGASRRGGAGLARLLIWLLRFSLPDQGRLFFNHHASSDLRRHALVLSQ